MNLDEYRGIYRREDFVKKFTKKIKLQTLPPELCVNCSKSRWHDGRAGPERAAWLGHGSSRRRAMSGMPDEPSGLFARSHCPCS